MGSSPAPEIKVKITGEDTGVSAAIKELGLQLQQLKRTQDETGSSARRMGDAEAGAGNSMREAREGARLLSEETGVHLSRGLTGVLARSSALGPILNAAFPVAAAIGFAEVIASAAEKFSSLIASTFIYTEAMQKEYALQVQTNNEIQKGNEKIAQLKKAYDLIGLSGSARGSVLARQAKDDVDEAVKQLERLKAKQIEVTEPGLFKRALGTVLSTGFGINTGIELPETQPGINDKTREVGAQQNKRDVAAEQQRTADKELADEKAAEAKTAAAKAKTELDAVNKAKLAQLEAGFANDLALYKAQHSRLDQDNEADYVKGLESLAAYYTRRKQLAAEASDKEIAALTAERSRVQSAPTKDKAEEIANATKVKALENQIAIAKENAAKTAQQLTNEQAQKQEELDKKVLDFQSQIARAQGQRFDEASARIAAEALEMGQKLREQGMAPDQVDAMVAKFKAAATQQAQFAGMKTGGQDAIAALAAEEEDLRLKNSAIVAEVRIAEKERERIPVLQKLAAEMKAAAVGKDQEREADDFAKSVDRIAVAAKKSQVSMQGFKDEASQALAGDLTTFLGSTIDQVHGVEDAFRQLAGAAVSSIQQIVAQLLVQLLMQKLVKAAESGGFSSGGLVPGLAAGGFISGPGTGTSDSIPARLSAGEFVMSARSVQDYGPETFARMNRGLNVGSIRGMSIPRFAEGGLVTHGSGSNGVDLNMNLGLEEGLVLKHLSSKSGGKDRPLAHREQSQGHLEGTDARGILGWGLNQGSGGSPLRIRHRMRSKSFA